MIYKFYILTGSLLLLLAACQQEQSSPAQLTRQKLPAKVDFNLHIRPLLSDRCFACHGPDKNTREADLALHTPEGAFGSLDSTELRFPFVPKRPKKSEAYLRIMSDDPDVIMPPPESNLSLNEYEKELIRKWIEQGAGWKDHWAYIPPEKPALPEIKDRDWPQNEIDHFTLAKMAELGLKPEPEASKAKLIRRVTLDLTGLPPSLEEIDHFLADNSPDAYEKLVDRLLASPHYGERMAANWLDAARYADSHGYQDDRPRTIWPWRDWVIDAFNQNLPYDDFVRWQLAGDLLPSPTYEQKLATAFNRNHPITQEGGVINEEYLTEYAADRTQTFATAFLGQTMMCARCHDHKYDPISQEEFYELFAFFNNVKGERGQISYFDLAPVPNMPVQDPLLDSTVQAVQTMIAQLEENKSQLMEEKRTAFAGWKEQHFQPQRLADDLSEGLLAHYQLDETESWYFSNRTPGGGSGRVNINLPPSIDKPSRIDGRQGKALEFNGANFLSLGEIGDFDHYDHFSFGGWIKHQGVHEKDAGIFSRRNGEQKRQGYQLALTVDNSLAAGLISDGRYFMRVETQQRIPKGQWAHAFLTYDGSGRASGLNIYINGEKSPFKVVRDSLQGQSILNGNDFLVGNWNHRARNLRDLYGFAGGAVDEVRLYRRTLSPLEVRILAEQGAPDGNLAEKALYQHYLLRKDSDYQALENELLHWRRQDQTIPSVMIMEEMDTIKTTYLLARGAYDAPVKEVSRGTPESILAFPEDLPRNRLGLAEWLFHEDNPLTARVYVNRLWQMCFGQGLVNTPDDLGSQGALPSHPALLDWLAVHFRESGWDTKAILKQIVLSATYRQSAHISTRKYKLDAKNVWLSRGPNVRLTAEMLRDQALAAGGLLNRKVGGKWVKPYQPPGIWKEMANQIGENKYRPSLGDDLYRRSIYTYFKRTIPPPTMLTLDASERAACTVKRQATSTPLQSLILLNDPQYVEASRVLAQRLIGEHTTSKEQIQAAFRTITSRESKPAESNLLVDLYESERSRFLQEPEAAEEIIGIGQRSADPALASNEVSALTVVINTIFNLDEAKFK
jgi:hypothetical protein